MEEKKDNSHYENFAKKNTIKETTIKKEASSQEILKKPEVPILCYHRIRNINYYAAYNNTDAYSEIP